MSYKVDLTDLDRSSGEPVTQQLVQRFMAAIDSGELAAGDQLPTTRALAAQAGINHLTAARVYRHLAEAGYVTSRVGAGTFVRALPPGAAVDGDDWQSLLLPENRPSLPAEAMLDSFRTPGQPEIVSLATGWPDPELYPFAELRRITREVFDDLGPDALSYLPAEGSIELREQIAARGRASGFAREAEEIIVTSGARQAIDVAVRAIVRPGDPVAVESPTFAGLLSSLQDAGARLLPVPVDDDGLRVEVLERHLARHEIKLCVLQSSSHNPTGRDLSEPRRRRLLDLARERSFFVLDDGVYATVRFGEPERPRLRAQAPSHVVYVDSLSKTIGGGLRVGWVAAQGPVLQRILALKFNNDVHSSSLAQHVAARYLATRDHDRLLAKTLPVYQERRDAMLAAVREHLGAEAHAPVPVGGHHVWVSLRRPVSDRALYAEALRQGVTFTPGSAILPDPSVGSGLRLSFSLLPPDRIREGVERLARALDSVRARGAATGWAAPS